jgi:predicted enzyme related to lactoylglutathione lyase
MGRAVVHFEVMGTDGPKLWSFYATMFGWEINSDNPMNYGTVDREANTNADGIGIGGGVGQLPDGMSGYVTFYVEVPDVEAALSQAESIGGNRVMGPEKVMDTIEIGIFADPEGNPIGVIKAAS